jgi:hypothetical protein
VTRIVVIVVILFGISIAGGVGYLQWKGTKLPGLSSLPSLPSLPSLSRATTSPASQAPHEAVPKESAPKPSTPEVRLTRDGIDLILKEHDEGVRERNIDRILRLITADANITIHMKQGTQVQSASLTREDYRKMLAMTFAFPSANDFTRTNTSVSLAADGQSAKVSFKSTETLHPGNREFKSEGEETLVISSRDGRTVITSLEQTVPGDSM